MILFQFLCVWIFSFLLKSGVAMAIFRISHHFQLVLMFTIFYNKKIFSLKSNICQQKKITRYQVINKENMLFGWEKKEDSSVFCLCNFFLI